MHDVFLVIVANKAPQLDVLEFGAGVDCAWDGKRVAQRNASKSREADKRREPRRKQCREVCSWAGQEINVKSNVREPEDLDSDSQAHQKVR